jgi:hypothetical protein
MTPLCVIGETIVRQSRDDVVAVYLGGAIWVCAEHAFHELNNRETQDDKPKKVRRHG